MDRLERNKILKDNLGVIKTVASEFYKRENVAIRYEFDDLFQIGVIGAMRGIEKFQDKYGTKMRTQVAFHAKYEMMNYVFRDKCFYERERNDYRPVVVMSSNTKINDNKYEYIDMYEDENVRWGDITEDINLGVVCELLSPRQREVFSLRFMNDFRKVDVAEKLGLTKQSITAIEKAISSKIKGKLGNKLKY